MDFEPLDLDFLTSQDDDDFLLFPSPAKKNNYNSSRHNEKVSPTTRWPSSARNAAKPSYGGKKGRRESCAIFNHLGEATESLELESFIDEELVLPDDDPSIDEAILQTPRGAADARDVAAAAAAREASGSNTMTCTPLAKFSFPISKDLYRTVLRPSIPPTFTTSQSKSTDTIKADTAVIPTETRIESRTDDVNSSDREPLLGTAFSNLKLSDTSTLAVGTSENASTVTPSPFSIVPMQQSCVPETTLPASPDAIAALDVANPIPSLRTNEITAFESNHDATSEASTASEIQWTSYSTSGKKQAPKAACNAPEVRVRSGRPENIETNFNYNHTQATPPSHMERSTSQNFLSKPDTPTRLRMPSKTQTAFRPLDMRPDSQLQMRPPSATQSYASCKASPTSIPLPVIDKEKEISRILQTMGPLPTYSISTRNGTTLSSRKDLPSSRNPFISHATTGMIPPPNSFNPRISRQTSLPRVVDINSPGNPLRKSPKRKSSLPSTRGGSGSAATSRTSIKADNDSEDSDDESVPHDNGRVKMRGVVSGPGSGVTKLPVPSNVNHNALKLDMGLLLQTKIPQPPRSRLKPPSISGSGYLGIGSRLKPAVKAPPAKARAAGHYHYHSSRSGPT